MFHKLKYILFILMNLIKSIHVCAVIMTDTKSVRRIAKCVSNLV